MKKLVLFVAVAFAISFASCSNKSNAEATAPEAESTAVVEEAVEEVAPAAEDTTVVVEEAAVEEVVEQPAK